MKPSRKSWRWRLETSSGVVFFVYARNVIAARMLFDSQIEFDGHVTCQLAGFYDRATNTIHI